MKKERNKNMKRFFAFALVFAMMLSLVACGKAPEEPAPATTAPAASTGAAETPETEAVNPYEHLYTKPTEDVTLDVWYAVSGVTAEVFEAQVNAYMEANPNIKINLSFAGSYADCAEKVSANLMTNTAPDVALMSAAPLYTGSRGDFTIEGLIQDPEFNKDDIYEGVWQYATYDNRICAIPYGVSVPVLFYNKDVVAAAGLDVEANPPETWEELYEMAKICQEKGNINNADEFWGFEVSDAPWLFKSMLNQNGCPIIETDGGITPAFNNEEAVEVASFWKKLSDEGVMGVNLHSNAENTFKAGNCAFIVASSIRLARWNSLEDLNFGVLSMPTFGEKSVALGGNHLVTFAQDDTKLAAAWDLIKYLTNSENHTEFSLATGYLPIHKSAADSEAVKTAMNEDPRRQVVFNEMDTAWSYWHFDEMGTMDSCLWTALANLELGTEPQQALDDAVDELESEM